MTRAGDVAERPERETAASVPHEGSGNTRVEAVAAEPRILRPLNYAKAAPGAGARVYDAPGGRKVLVAQVLGQVFMKRPFDDPFSALDTLLRTHRLGGAVNAALAGVLAIRVDRADSADVVWVGLDDELPFGVASPRRGHEHRE